MKIEAFNRPACRVLRDKMQEALDELKVELGVTFSVGNMRFTEDTVSVKIDAAVSRNGKAVSPSAAAFKR